MQCACAILPSVACVALQHFSVFCHKRYDFKKLLNTICAISFSLQLLSDTLVSLRRNERDVIKHLYSYSCKVPVVPVIFYWNLHFFNSLLIKFHESCSFDGRFVLCGQTGRRADSPEESNGRFS